MAHRITDDCLACGACVDECPNDAISEGDPIYVIDPELCDDCGTCVDSCPNDAIVAD
jgi:ferredoxin